MFSVSQVHNVSRQYNYLFRFCGLILRYIVLYFLPKKSFLLPTFYEIRVLVGSQGVAVADVVKASALVVEIAPAWVRVPAVPAVAAGFESLQWQQRKWALGMTPAHNVPQ